MLAVQLAQELNKSERGFLRAHTCGLPSRPFGQRAHGCSRLMLGPSQSAQAPAETFDAPLFYRGSRYPRTELYSQRAWATRVGFT